MSYCRFSSDDWASDLYVYAHVDGGYAIHVAGNRVVGDVPKCEHLFTKDTLPQFFEAHEVQMRFLDTAKRVPIGLPCDGESYYLATALETLDKLYDLRDLGYHVPQYALDALKEEADAD